MQSYKTRAKNSGKVKSLFAFELRCPHCEYVDTVPKGVVGTIECGKCGVVIFDLVVV